MPNTFVLPHLPDKHEMAQLEAAVSERIHEVVGGAVKDIEFEWQLISDKEAEINITVYIDAQVPPRDWRGSFAGLSSKVRDTLGDVYSIALPSISTRTAHL